MIRVALIGSQSERFKKKISGREIDDFCTLDAYASYRDFNRAKRQGVSFDGTIELLEQFEIPYNDMNVRLQGLRLYELEDHSWNEGVVKEYIIHLNRQMNTPIEFSSQYEKIQMTIQDFYEAKLQQRLLLLRNVNDEIYSTRLSMDFLLEQSSQLVRINQACVVSKKSIVRYNRQFVWLLKGECELIGRVYRNELFSQLGDLYVYRN